MAAPLGWRIDNTTVFEPDLLVVPKSPGRHHQPVRDPILLVEIASLSTARLDRTVKFDIYAAAGVLQYWIVEPGDEE